VIAVTAFTVAIIVVITVIVGSVALHDGNN
jgi:hypothetical protein